MNKTVSIVIKTVADNQAAKKSTTEYTKAIKDQAKEVTLLNKTVQKYCLDSHDQFKRLEGVARLTGHGIQSAFQGALTGLEKFNKGVDSLKHNFLNLKTIIATSLAGMAAARVFHAGQEKFASEARVRREFGSEDGESLIKLAKASAKRGGVSEEAALRGLIPIMEATSLTQAGTRLRGGKVLNAAGAAAVRHETTVETAKIWGRISAVMGNEVDPETLGQMIANVGSGTMGVRQFAQALHLNKSSVGQLEAANTKGNIYGVLTPQERERFGIKKGQRTVGNRTLIDMMVSRHAMTEAGADSISKTAPFQARAVAAKGEDAVADVGADIIEWINHKLGGGNLVGAFDKTLGFAKEHSTGLLAAGGSFAAARLAGKMGIGKLLGSKGGALGAAGELLGGKAPLPVFVTNMGGGLGGLGGGLPGVAAIPGLGQLNGTLGLIGKNLGPLTAALGAGYLAGTLLDKKLAISDNITGTGINSTVAKDNMYHETTARGVGSREVSMARTLSHMTDRKEAARRMLDFVRHTDKGGVATGFGNFLAQSLLTGNTGDFEKLSKDESALDRSLATTRGTPAVHITIGNVSGPATDPVNWVRSMMPEFEKQLMMALKIKTAGGTVPASR